MPRALNRFVILCCFMLGACGTHQLASQEPPALILLPPAELTGELLLKQKITFAARGSEQQFLVIARLTRQRSKLVVLLPVGQQLLTLDYDGDRLLQTDYSQAKIPGREILASMQFALWPEQALRRHYSPNDGWRVEIADRERNLLTSSGPVLRITHDTESLVVDNHLHDYRVVIQTLEKKEL